MEVVRQVSLAKDRLVLNFVEAGALTLTNNEAEQERCEQSNNDPRIQDKNVEEEEGLWEKEQEEALRRKSDDPPPPAVKNPVKGMTSKQPVDQTHHESDEDSEDSEDSEKDVVRSSPARAGDSHRQQAGRACVSKSGKNSAAPASKQTTQPARIAGSMAPPPPPPPSKGRNDPRSKERSQSEAAVPPRKSAQKGLSKHRAASETITPTPRETAASTHRPLRPRRNQMPTVQEEVSVKPYITAKGAKSSNWALTDKDPPAEPVDILAIEKANRKKARQASKSAAVKRTASDADDGNDDDLWERPEKKVRRQDLPDNDLVDSTVQVDEALRPRSSIADDPGDFDTDEEGDGDDEDEDDNGDEHGNDNHETKRSKRDAEDEIRRDTLENAIMFDLEKRVDGDVNYNVLLKRLGRDRHGNKVPEEEFHSTIERLMEEGTVRSSGAGPKRRLHIDSKEDGVEAKTPDNARILGNRPKTIKKHGNQRQPTTGVRERWEKGTTSWLDHAPSASNDRASLAQTPQVTSDVDALLSEFEDGEEDEEPESGPPGGNELQDDSDVEAQQAEQQQAKQGKRQGRQSTDVKRGSIQQTRQQPPETSPRKFAQKRKAETDDPVLEEEGMLLSLISPNAQDANSDPDNKEPPRKKEKKPAKDKTQSKE